MNIPDVVDIFGEVVRQQYIRFTMRTQEAVLSLKKDSNMISTSLMIAELHVQDWADLRVSTDPSSHSGCFVTSKLRELST